MAGVDATHPGHLQRKIPSVRTPWIIAWSCLTAATVQAGSAAIPVFHIAKSENKNQVHYAVKVDSHCRPVGEQPVYGYWRNLENGEKDVSKLLNHELPAYGLTEPRAIRVTPTGGEVHIALRGFPDRALIIQTLKTADGCRARALTSIAKQSAVLRSIYVKLGFLFSVDYAIVRGVRLPDGQPVQEKVDD
jgi:Domain of unknown function (DUF4833)